MFRSTILSAVILVTGSSVAHAQTNQYEVYEPVVGGQSACGCSSGSTCSCGQQGSEIGDRIRGLGSSFFNLGGRRCGSYFKVFGGTNGVHDITDAQGPTTDRFTFRDGFLFGTARGRQVAPNVRLELESAFRKNSFDQYQLTFPPAPAAISAELDGRLEVSSLMMNTLFNSDRRILGLKPYAGMGVGGAYVDGDLRNAGGTCDIGEVVFAYQAILGAERQVSSRADAFVEYRYMGTSDFDVDCNIGGAPSTFETDYTAENVVFGIRFKR